MSLLASQLCQCQGALTGVFAAESAAVLTYNTLAAHVVDVRCRVYSSVSASILILISSVGA
jgi:hypothetical protein